MTYQTKQDKVSMSAILPMCCYNMEAVASTNSKIKTANVITTDYQYLIVPLCILLQLNKQLNVEGKAQAQGK